VTPRPWLTALRRLAIATVVAMILLGVGNREGVEDPGTPPMALVLALDRTTSMAATDGTGRQAGRDLPRLDAAKDDLSALVDELIEAEVALVSTGAQARLDVPLTGDRMLFREQLEQIEPEPPTTGQGSSLARPLSLIPTLLEVGSDGRDDTDRPRVVLVLAGDGEENGQAVSSAEEIARDYGPMLDLVDAALVLGYGTEQGATMPFDGGLVSDPQGSGPGVSKSDPENLQAVADAVGGTYLPVVRGGDSPTDVTQIATQLREQAYADLPAAVSAREVTWMWALLLLALILPELTTAWRDWWQTRRFVRGGTR